MLTLCISETAVVAVPTDGVKPSTVVEAEPATDIERDEPAVAPVRDIVPLLSPCDSEEGVCERAAFAQVG